ncbi:MAG: polyphosphate kinase 2 [Pseudomonadota bacterium]
MPKTKTRPAKAFATPFAKPFDGAISQYFQTEFPKPLRQNVEQAGRKDMLAKDFPYRKRLSGEAYDAAYQLLQIELVKMQAWAGRTGARIAIVFEGRDTAGKGGTIKRFVENLNPRGARIVALPKPSETERGQWYFQRYIGHLPSEGEIVFFDRSWYNRAVVERVFGFSSDEERELFFQQVPDFEQMMVRDGIHLFKIWLTVGRAEQMRRVLARESDPLKQWKLSQIDVSSLSLWGAYTDAIQDMFIRSHRPSAPWHVVRSDDKRRARLAAMELVLSALPYDHKTGEVARAPDPKIAGGPELLDRG